MILFILIVAAAVAFLILAMCRAAARADAQLATFNHSTDFTLWEQELSQP